jgi:hypothetical protein
VNFKQERLSSSFVDMNNFPVVYSLKAKQSGSKLFNFEPSKSVMSTEIEYSDKKKTASNNNLETAL